MSYPETHDYSLLVAPKTNANLTGLNLAAAAAQWCGFYAMCAVQVTRISFFVTTAVTAGTQTPVVEIKRRPTYASTSGAVSLGTMAIPNGATVGSVYYQDITYGSTASNKYVNAGEEISLELKTQASDGGTAAGVGFFAFEFAAVCDNAANQTNMINKLA